MNDLHWLLDNDAESGYRARMISCLEMKDTQDPEIRKITNHHDNNIRKWIHRFNEDGIDGIVSRKHIRNAHKITDNIERKIVEIASNDPRKYRLKFSTWSLRVLAGYIMEEKKLVESISHTEIKNVLVKHGIEWRNSKTVLGKSRRS